LDFVFRYSRLMRKLAVVNDGFVVKC